MFKSYFLFYVLLMFVILRLYGMCPNKLSCHIEYNSRNVLLEEINFYFPLDKYKNNMIWKVRELLPKPQSEMVLGLVLGVNQLYYIPEFRELLKSTGTIHVVVVSGFNISLVSNIVLKLFKNRTSIKTVYITFALTFIYALITGFDPPIVRALIMFCFLLLGMYYGRKLNTLYVLILSALVMLAIKPQYIVSLSFQLSFMATLGLVYFGSFFNSIIKSDSIIVQDFVATLSAQLLVWPLLAYNFYTLNVIGIIVNSLVLWTIPWSTILGFGFILSIYISKPLALVISLPLIVLIDIFIFAVEYFDKFKGLNLIYAPSVNVVIGYYILVFILPFLFKGFTDS